MLRVERRLSGDWNLATKTLRQTIARQQRLGQDSSAARAYLESLQCLQAEVNNGQHDAFLTASTGKAPQRQAPAAKPTKIPAPAAPSTAAAPSAAAAATPQVPSGQQLLTSPQQPSVAAAQPSQRPAPANQPAARVGSGAGGGVVMPGTAESYALAGQGGLSGSGAVPITRPLDGSKPNLQLGSAAPAAANGPVLRVPPKPPKFRGDSLAVLATSAATAAAPAVQSAPAAEPESFVVAPRLPAPEAAPAAATPAVAAVAGDAEIVGQACVYFTRPEVEVFENRVYANRYQEGERVCHEGAMYRCDNNRWSDQGACSAHPDAAQLNSSTLEAEPRRK